MNLTKLKNYAPDARTTFIEAVTRRAGVFGIRKDQVEEVSETGDIALIGGQPFPRSVVPLRRKLLDRIAAEGFDAVMEAMAYTWFNRFVAFRFMELHGYFDHGYRVLSHPEGGLLPEIVQHAEHVSLSGLDRDEVIRLKLAGNKDEELYRLLLLAQCQEMNRLLPDIFSRLDDATILLLPDNLLHTDSLVRQLVAASDPEDWQEVEVLGWLYQFYISEKKDSVMARKSAVPKEDIPAVTQLFTPHWIVRYLVENSLGRLWLLNRPGSRLRDHMPYYIEGEAEKDFLKISKPEDIRLCDPAVGSGHMLTYAFDLLYLIYEEEGYLASEIPGLILRHNLHGLEICPRAAQLAELALVFKARAKSRRFFQPEHFVRPQITELQDVRFAEGELRDYIQALSLGELFNEPMLKLLHQFEEAKNFGSLIQPCVDAQTIAYARGAIAAKGIGDQLFLSQTHPKVLRVLEQAEALTQRYHVVVANPPYMGWKQMNEQLKAFSSDTYADSKTDLFAMFIERAFVLLQVRGFVGMVTMQSWMFLATFERLRKKLLQSETVISMAHLGPRGFDTIGGEVVQTTSFVSSNSILDNYRGAFVRLTSGRNEEEKEQQLLAAIADKSNENLFRASSRDFASLPGSPVAYWISPSIRRSFETALPLHEIAEAVLGMTSSDNNRFIRRWWEVAWRKVSLLCESHDAASASNRKWFPYNKGGEFRKWYGNNEYLINWENRGEEVMGYATERYGSPTKQIRNLGSFFKPSITWSFVSGSQFGVRLSDPGFIFDVGGSSAFPPVEHFSLVTSYLCSSVVPKFLEALNPTLNFQAGNIGSLPIPRELVGAIPNPFEPIARDCVQAARADWDNFETSWDFRDPPLLRSGLKGAMLEESWQNWAAHCTAAIRRMQELETENNRLFIAAYGLESELQPEVPEEQITLARAEPKKDMAAFLSYAIGCMMGRYSLARPGLVLADAGGTVEDYQRIVESGAGVPPALTEEAGKMPAPHFQPDADGILPITELPWFEDDVALRVEEFLRVTFGPDTLEASLDFLARSLGPKGQETPRDTLRRYLADEFYKNHLSNERAYGYKNRPIYWLFSSGKEGAFQCLVYLHRYHPGTLARMRTEYVIPLQGKLNARVAHLEEEKTHATSTPQRTKLQKEQDKLKKQQVELIKFDEQLRHYADLKITLDLDDGVKVNYAKFGPLLAEAKKVCGTKED